MKDGCKTSYAAVAQAIYGGGRTTSLPVFCAPRKIAGGRWEETRVECSANWLDTVGYRPWDAEGAPNPAPAPDDIPTFACVGSPHLFDTHMKLPAGGETGTGFRCRRRIFRVLVAQAEKSLADQRRNIALMCSEMRGQVWGEKYPDINKTYQAWCNKNPRLREKGFCLPPGETAGGPEDVPLPFLRLSREELLFFYGHRELYCRADRKGLLHFLDPVAQSVISAVAGIPFVGAALAAAAQVAYSIAMNLLEDAAFDALKGVVERIMAKLLRPVVTQVFKLVQGKLLRLATAACATTFRDGCPVKGLRSFAALPPRDRWIERALACPGRPTFDDRMRREAVAAGWRIADTARVRHLDGGGGPRRTSGDGRAGGGDRTRHPEAR